MARVVAQRLLLGLFTLWVVSLLIFGATEILPGDVAAAILGRESTEDQRAALREQLGLDRPALQRYAAWLAGMARGDLGMSLATETPVSEILAPRLINSLLLAGVTALLAVPLALGLGLLAAAYPGGLYDKALTVVSLFVISLPEFVVALLLVLLLAVHFHLLPVVVGTPDFSTLGSAARALALPALTLLAAVQAHMIRMTRAAVLDVMGRPYIEMALLKGAPKRRIILHHALPNALAPIVNVVALNLGYLLSGVVVVEVVFSFPGLGRLMVDSVATRDMPVVQAGGLIFCTAFVLLTLAADLFAALANPWLRQTR
jgi:peptide/nickel transport system permease protein